MINWAVLETFGNGIIQIIWQRVGTDLFFWEKKIYLLIVDYFSRYIEVAHLNIL